MGEKQKAALEIMRQRNAGAIYTHLGWVWRSDIRLSEEAAEAILHKVSQDETWEES